MPSKTFQLNIPISKIDEEQRIVTGIATAEVLDSQGDIVDYEASKKAFSEWKGNIREMHGDTAVGKAIDVQFDDKNKQVILSSYISESADGENAWTKIKEGILTGYSIGGKVFEVVKDKAIDGANRVVDYALSETSLVDNPACPVAEFLMVKSADGGLQRVEDMKKSVYDAATAISLASQLVWLIQLENDEPDQADDLKTAFNALRDFIGKEVAEGDDFDTAGYLEVIELASKAINLRKDKSMSKSEKELEKTNVVGGEERDHEANVTETQEEAGRPTDDTTERAAAVAEAAEEPEAKEDEKSEAKADEPEEKAEAAAPAEEESETEDKGKKEEKSADATTLLKNIEASLAKLNDERGSAELKKAFGDIQKSVDKVAKSMTALEGRIKALEDQPLPTKGKANYAVVAKGEEAEADDELKALLARSDELANDPSLAKSISEPAELSLKIRKAMTKAKQ